jgi:hypothetical protein
VAFLAGGDGEHNKRQLNLYPEGPRQPDTRPARPRDISTLGLLKDQQMRAAITA